LYPDLENQGDLHVSFELADRSWKLSCSDGTRSPNRYSVNAGDQAAVLDCRVKARARCGLDPQAKVHTCYEAGRDGWWRPHERRLTDSRITRGLTKVVREAAVQMYGLPSR